MVALRPEDEAQTNNAVEYDHDRRENGVPRDSVAAGIPRQHDGYDQRNLDNSHGDRKKDGTKGLSQPHCENLGVMNGGEHSCAEQ
jgi:hypothetical protein